MDGGKSGRRECRDSCELYNATGEQIINKKLAV